MLPQEILDFQSDSGAFLAHWLTKSYYQYEFRDLFIGPTKNQCKFYLSGQDSEGVHIEST